MTPDSRFSAISLVTILIVLASEFLPWDRPAFWGTFVAAVAIWFATTGLFVLCCAAKAALDGGQLTTFWRVNLTPFALLFALLDPVFNLTFGTVMFVELPREWLFTSRCKRHKAPTVTYSMAPWRTHFAYWWCRQLNIFAPGHC